MALSIVLDVTSFSRFHFPCAEMRRTFTFSITFVTDWLLRTNWAITSSIVEGDRIVMSLFLRWLPSSDRSDEFLNLKARPIRSIILFSFEQINAEKYQLVRKGFDQLGFASDELDAIYSVMAAVIHIGDLDIVPAGPGKDNTDRCKIANPAQTKIGK